MRTLASRFSWFAHMLPPRITRCVSKTVVSTHSHALPAWSLLGTGAGLIFKGSGFYTTDYRSEGYKQAAKKDSGDGGGAKTEAPKTESKPAAPAPAPSPKAESKPASGS